MSTPPVARAYANLNAPIGFNSKRSRTNATVVSAHSIAVATWPRVADVTDDLSRSPVHSVNVKANSRATILIRAAPNDPARTAAVIASNRRFKYFGTAAFAVRLLRLDQEIVSGLPRASSAWRISEHTPKGRS
jgi:hypothetical protein